MDEDLQKELDLYKTGNIDELIVLMDEEKRVPKNPMGTVGRMPTPRGMSRLQQSGRFPGNNSRLAHPSANRFSGNGIQAPNANTRHPSTHSMLKDKPETIMINDEVESNLSTNTNKTPNKTIRRTEKQESSSTFRNIEAATTAATDGMAATDKTTGTAGTVGTAATMQEEDTQSETETIVNGRVRRAKPDLETSRKQKPVKPVAGIDENWFLQKTDEGINLLDYTGKLPLSVPNEDLLKLNSVRSAARSVLRKKNEEKRAIPANAAVVPEVYTPIAASSETDNVPDNSSAPTENVDTPIPVDVNSMLDSGTQLLSKVRSLLKSNIPIPPNGLEGIEEEVDPNKPVVPQEKILELHEVQDKWIELDNEIKGIRALIKDLQAKQRELSEYLKSEMLKYQIPHLKSLQGDKIFLKSQNRKGTYKKDYIFTKLQEVLQDPEMAANLSDQLENGRPVSESINLSRTKK